MPAARDQREAAIAFRVRLQEVDGRKSLRPEDAGGPSAPDEDDPSVLMMDLAAYGIQKRGQRFHHVLGISADVEGLDGFEGTANHKHLSRMAGLKAHRLGPKPPTDGVCSGHSWDLAQAQILSRQISQERLADRQIHSIEPVGSPQSSPGAPSGAAHGGKSRLLEAEVGIQSSLKESSPRFFMILTALHRGKASIDGPRDPGRWRAGTFERENLQRFEGGADCVGSGSATKLNEHRLPPFLQRHIDPGWLGGLQTSAKASVRWLFQSEVLQPTPPAISSSLTEISCHPEPALRRARNAWRSGICRSSWPREDLSKARHWQVSGYGRSSISRTFCIAGRGATEHV